MRFIYFFLFFFWEALGKGGGLLVWVWFVVGYFSPTPVLMGTWHLFPPDLNSVFVEFTFLAGEKYIYKPHTSMTAQIMGLYLVLLHHVCLAAKVLGQS